MADLIPGQVVLWHPRVRGGALDVPAKLVDLRGSQATIRLIHPLSINTGKGAPVFHARGAELPVPVKELTA